MKLTQLKSGRIVRALCVGLSAAFALAAAHAQQIQWGLTVTNINNPIAYTVVTNGPGNTNGPGGDEAPVGSISITAGGGDTYGSPDSFTYSYQTVTGDFDIRVRVVNVTATDPLGQDSPKGSLMVRSSLDATANDFQINALPLAPSGRDGQIESIGRIVLANDTDDLTGTGFYYGPGGIILPFQGDTTYYEYCTYPDVWLRVKRQGQKLMSFFATDATFDYPSGWNMNPDTTNGWQLLCVAHADTNFPDILYVGLSTVAHNGDISDTTHTVTSTYDSYGPTPTPASIPSVNGQTAYPGTGPGAFPNTRVLAANISAAVSADGLGYPSDVVQSNQSAPQQIVWNDSSGYGGVTRDIIANITAETPGAFSFARYQAGAFDFMLDPADPVAALENLGPYSNPARERYTSGDTNVSASQAWAPSPDYGFAFTTVAKNGEIWNDGTTNFYAATYMQLDGVATGQGYDMVGGHFRGGQFYTRTTKLVTGPLAYPGSQGPDSGALQRCAIPVALAWFPYDQGWIAGYFDSPLIDATSSGVPFWKDGNGWGRHSGTVLDGYPTLGGQALYNSPTGLLTWLQTPDGSGVYSGLAKVSPAGVNSLTDGMLFTIGDEENNSIRGPSANNAAFPDGSGWYVAVRDIETSKPDPTIYATGGGNDAESSFSYLYIPYNAYNLVGGHIGTNGATVKGAGSFTVTHLSTGRYAISIPGKTSTNGVILLQNTGYLADQPPGYTNVVDTSYLSYEYGGTNTPSNAFIVESHYVDDSGGGEGVVGLRDAEFYFVYVDFQNPLAPPASAPPVLTISYQSGSIIVSWTNGAGYVLQETSSLASPVVWTDVGTANPSAPIPANGGAKFFRVRSP